MRVLICIAISVLVVGCVLPQNHRHPLDQVQPVESMVLGEGTVLEAGEGPDLHSVLIAWRPDLITVDQKKYAREQIDKLRGKEQIKDSFKHSEVFMEVVGGTTNTWRVLVQPVCQLRASGVTITLAKLKEILKYDQMTDRLKIAIAEPYMGIPHIENTWGWNRAEE